MPKTPRPPAGPTVEDTLAAIPDAARRDDCIALCALLAEWTGQPPALWGSGMVGFGRVRYRYMSGHGGECFFAGFASRKDAIVVYLTAGVEEDRALLAKLGKHRVGKGCLYLRRLADADRNVLRQLVARGIARLERVEV